MNKRTRKDKYLMLLGIISISVYGLSRFYPIDRTMPYSKEMFEAAQIMEQVIFKIQQDRIDTGIEIDPVIDPNQTGLIGPEHGDLTTSLGHLQAKRTTTNPNMAGLILHLLERAGVKKGETVAIGASASFPALLVATFAACKAMGAESRVIISLGASSYGATDSRFNLLRICQLLKEMALLEMLPVAVSMGGEGDQGMEFSWHIKQKLIRDIQTAGIQFIDQADFRTNVEKRLQIYGRQDIVCFVNIGGSETNMGKSALALHVKPGLNRSLTIPEKKQRGVLFELSDSGIPIIHLLYIKGLILEYGLPWDPIPLPEAGENQIVNHTKKHKIPFLILTGLYFASAATLIYLRKRNKGQ